MKLWERNLEALRCKDPDLAARIQVGTACQGLSVEPAKNGAPIVKRDGVCLHSSYDPVREAAGWRGSLSTDPSLPLTVLGLGFGYHLEALAEAGYHGVVVEPDPALFSLALHHRDLTTVMERFRFLVGVPLETMQRSHRDLLAGQIAAHPASLRSSPDYIGTLAGYAASLNLVRRGGLKILLVNPIYGGSLPAAHHCASALELMGHEVEVFAAESFAKGMALADEFSRPDHRKAYLGDMASFLSRAVEMKAFEFGPDLVLALAQAPLLPPALDRLEQMGIPTAFWFVEDYRLLPYWRDVAASYSYFFAIQKGEFPAELVKSGVRHQAYLPTAASPAVHAPIELSETEREEYGSPLSFVGAGYYNRQRFFRGLIDYPFKIWGSDWPLELPLLNCIQRSAARIDTDTCVRIFNASAINLNLHSSTHLNGVDPDGDFVNPRTFEIACCSAFQLVDRRSLMPELFAEGDLETFGSLPELRDKIDHFLTSPEARQSSAHKGRNRVMAEHTYQARMEELLALMISRFPSIAEKQQGRLNKQESFRVAMAEHYGMRDLLDRLPSGKAVSLEDIFREIGTNKGKLSRAEKIFLMLKNIEVVQVGAQ